jgi:hypothetical protein
MLTIINKFRLFLFKNVLLLPRFIPSKLAAELQLKLPEYGFSNSQVIRVQCYTVSYHGSSVM